MISWDRTGTADEALSAGTEGRAMHLTDSSAILINWQMECGWLSPLSCPMNRPAEPRTCHFARPIVDKPPRLLGIAPIAICPYPLQSRR